MADDAGPAKGGPLYLARMAERRKEQLEQRLRNKVRAQNLYGSLSTPENEEQIDAIREVALPAIDQVKQKKEAKQRAPISLPALGPSRTPTTASRFPEPLSLIPTTASSRPRSYKEILERAREKRRNAPDASCRFDENIGKMMHEKRQKLRDSGHKSKRPGRTPTLPSDHFEKIVRAADAEQNGQRLYPLKDVLPKKVWEKIAQHNSKLGGSKPKLSTFKQLFKYPVFKNPARARFNRAATYYGKNIASALAGV